MSIPPIQPQVVPLSLDLNTTLPNPFTPWEISSRIFNEMKTQKQVPYKKAQVLPEDPEWRFIWRHFHSDKPYRYGIKKIFCIFERQQQQLFESYFSSIEIEAKSFKPSWNLEPRASQRAEAIKRWSQAISVFTPVSTVEKDGRTRNWKEVKVLPLWHGSAETVCDSVAKTGFTFFGKTSLGGKKPKNTDGGFFGSGIYFTNSARYAADIYSKGHILLGWVSMREPFPVVGDPNQEDMQILSGKGPYKDYNAHYVPVASANPSDPYEPYYFPVQSGGLPHCDEIVVFQKPQTLPRFWIELQVEGLYLINPSVVPQFVEDFIPHLLQVLQNEKVDKDKKLRNHLGQILGILLTSEGNDYLDNEYQILYGKLVKLLDPQGNIDKQVSLEIVGPSTPPISQKAVFPPSIVPASSSQAPPTYNVFQPSSSLKSSSKVEQKQSFFLNKGKMKASVQSNLSPPLTPIPNMAFGKAKWAEYMSEIDEGPPLPSNIETILDRPCSIWPGKKIRDTHLLILVPHSIKVPIWSRSKETKNETLTLGDLVERNPYKRTSNGYKIDEGLISASKFNNAEYALRKKSEPSHWILITPDIIPDSKGKYLRLADWEKLLAQYSQKSGLPYRLPTAVEAAVSIHAEYTQTRTPLYPNPGIICDDKTLSTSGGYGGKGILVNVILHSQQRVGNTHYIVVSESSIRPGIAAAFEISDGFASKPLT